MNNGENESLKNLTTSTREAHGQVYPDKKLITKGKTSLEANGSSRERLSQITP